MKKQFIFDAKFIEPCYREDDGVWVGDFVSKQTQKFSTKAGIRRKFEYWKSNSEQAGTFTAKDGNQVIAVFERDTQGTIIQDVSNW